MLTATGGFVREQLTTTLRIPFQPCWPPNCVWMVNQWIMPCLGAYRIQAIMIWTNCSNGLMGLQNDFGAAWGCRLFSHHSYKLSKIRHTLLLRQILKRLGNKLNRFWMSEWNASNTVWNACLKTNKVSFQTGRDLCKNTFPVQRLIDQ